MLSSLSSAQVASLAIVVSPKPLFGSFIILFPVAGTVGTVYIKEGQQVDAGELITIIE